MSQGNLTPHVNSPVELFGAPGSPYTRKMVAWLRYRRIPYQINWRRHETPAHYPEPPVRLLPTFYFRDDNGELEAVVDSSPIIRRLETEYSGRSTLPMHPVLAFLNDLIEDYGDEWVTKMMFHYRWHFDRDATAAGPLLTTFGNPQVDNESLKIFSKNITDRQVGRLFVVGSNDVTAPIIEASYARLIHIMDDLIRQQGYVLGSRPSSGDFAIYGQFTQLAQVEPTSFEQLIEQSARFRSWVMLVEDLSGISVSDDDWLDIETAKERLNPLLTEIGRTYVPVMIANAVALNKSETEFETTVDGQHWVQPTFNYQAKCIQWIRESYFRLDEDDRLIVDDLLKGTGCLAMFQPQSE